MDDVKNNAIGRLEKCEDCIRNSPSKAMLIAVAAGYLLQRLPVRSILATQVRLLGALTTPALLAFGTIKIFEALQCNARKTSTKNEMPRNSRE
jgi:hypothetical protein